MSKIPNGYNLYFEEKISGPSNEDYYFNGDPVLEIHEENRSQLVKMNAQRLIDSGVIRTDEGSLVSDIDRVPELIREDLIEGYDWDPKDFENTLIGLYSDLRITGVPKIKIYTNSVFKIRELTDSELEHIAKGTVELFTKLNSGE